MALLIHPDGRREEVQGLQDNGALTWEQIKEAIGGGFVQHVSCNAEHAEGHDHFFCDEEGKLKGLPVNAHATSLSTHTMADDVLVGSILFCKSNHDDDADEDSF